MPRVVIAATFTSEPVQESMLALLAEAGLAVDLEFAPYNQVFQQLADPTSATRGNRGGVNVVVVRVEDWSGAGTHGADLVLDAAARTSMERNVREFVGLVQAAAESSPTPFIVCAGRPSAALAAHAESAAFLGGLHAELAAALSATRGVHVVLPDDVDALYDVAGYDNPAGNRLGHVPYTPAYFAALGGTLARRVHGLLAPPHKVVVLDCDNTLWKGVCGEVGAAGVEIDTPRAALQRFMLERHDAGMLLCLASKNNEEDAWEVFDTRPDMLLRRDHVVAWRINWEAKSGNIRALAAELQLGLDSFIFVDDDPAVCAEVRANCPEVLTLQLPHAVEEIPRFLRHVWAFDQVNATAEDAKRSRMYKENAAREQLRRQAGGLDDFLASLGLEITVSEMRAEHVERVSQLTQRTNQFNFTTIRRAVPEIEQLRAEPDAGVLVVDVKDRFGDYGLVGVAIHRVRERALTVDSFLLSCRALGRGVEHRMLARLGELAQERGLERVECVLRPTAKNQPARDFLHAVGASHRNESEDGIRFDFPAGVAAAMKFEPAQAGDAPDVATESGTTARQDAADDVQRMRRRTDGLNRIANELFDAERILALRPASTSSATDASGGGAPAGGPPATDAERRLAAIWERVLRVAPLGRESNFFDVGGTSLLGVQLFTEVEAEFGRSLSLAVLFESPTIASLAARLESAEETRWRSLVAIKPSGTRPPLFGMHAAGGHVLFYRDLAAYLHPDQPLWALQARGVDRTQTHHDRVEDMAAFYLEEVRMLQPTGPYHLCGSSFGGLVAYEMAQQLRAAGEEVALLAIFDTYGPGYPVIAKQATGTRLLRRQAERFDQVRATLQALDGRARIDYVRSKVRKVGMKLKRKLLWKKNEFEMKFSAATGRSLPKDLQRNHAAIQRALDSYRQQPYEGSMVLFRAEQQPHGAQPNPSLGWGTVVRGGLEIHEVPGSHGALTQEPFAPALAAKLNPYLDRAQGVGPASSMGWQPGSADRHAATT